MAADQREPGARAGAWAAGGVAVLVATIGAGLVEWAVYARDHGGRGLLTILGFDLVVGWVAAIAVGVPAGGLAAVAWRRAPIGRPPGWALGFLLLLAAVPYPLFAAIGRRVGTVTDVGLVGGVVGAVSVLGIAASLAVAGAGAALVAAVLARTGLARRRPSLPLFWALGFPGPWVAIPLAVAAARPEALLAVARPLYPLLIALLAPLVYVALRRAPRWLGLAAAVGTPALAVAGVGALAAGVGFEAAALDGTPLASEVGARVLVLADADGDGHAALFERRDCDESDPRIHALAFDEPGNGVDEDCDGADATSGGPDGDVPAGAAPYPLAGARRLNVLLILVDSLRADRVHFLGYERETTPNLDRLAARSLVFRDAVAQHPSTGPSVPSMLAGRYPEALRWDPPARWNDFPLTDGNVLLSDVLGRHGYQTAALVSPWIHAHIVGLGDHFESYDLLYPGEAWRRWARDGARVSAVQAIRFLERRDAGRPFFLLVHFVGPHEPYVNHDPPGRTFGDEAADRYDSDVHWSDLWIGVLLAYLEMNDLGDETLVIVTSDHGEEFGEHGKRFHGHQLYQESLSVPLLVHVPGVEPREVGTRVALVDIVPTVLDALGIAGEREALQGVSLLRTADGAGPGPDRPIFAALADRSRRPIAHGQAILQGRYKLILDGLTGAAQLYDLATDPGEQTDLSADRPEVAARLRARLAAFTRSADPSWQAFLRP